MASNKQGNALGKGLDALISKKNLQKTDIEPAEVINQETEEELMAQMRKTTRYEIRKATSLGITIKTTNDPKAIQKFYDLEILTDNYKLLDYAII